MILVNIRNSSTVTYYEILESPLITENILKQTGA